jgi:hypothetical protein
MTARASGFQAWMRAAACLVALAAPAGALRAQSWLPAARAAAEAELVDDFAYAGPVALGSGAVSPLSPAVAGLSGTYQAAVSGTDWIAWGLLDDAGAPVVSALARSGDPPDALPLFAAKLGAFWAGDTQGFPLFDLAQYLGLHAQPPAQPLSVELRQSTVRALLDLHHADLTRYLGYPDEFAQPISAVVRSPDFPLALVGRDVARALAEWDLDDPFHPVEIAWGFNSLGNALYGRAYQDAGALPLLAQLVGTITAADRSNHPAFSILLDDVVSYHLDLRAIKGGPLLPARDPSAVYRFVTAWRAVHDPATANQNDAADVADAAYRLPSYLDLAAPERAASLALAQELASAQTAACLKGLASFEGLISLFESRWGSPDPRRFGDLDAALRGAFAQYLADRLDSLPEPSSLRDDVLRFLARAIANGSVPSERRDAILGALSTALNARAAALLTSPLPAADAFDNDFQDRVATTAEVAKAIGRRGALDAFLDRFLVPYPGSFYLPPESAAHLAARRAAVHALWNEQGSLLLDRQSALGRDDGELEAVAAFLRAALPFAGGFHHVIVLAQVSATPEGDHAGETGWTWVQDSVSEDDTPVPDRLAGYGLLRALEHEVGHNVHRNLPHPIDTEMNRLYERSDLTPASDDFMSTINWEYGASLYTEEAAEAFSGFLDDARFHLDRALDLARQGKPLLLQKYLVWAGELARLAGDGDGFPLYRRVLVPGAAQPIQFRGIDRLQVLARDGEGRIVRMSDSRGTYVFTYAGRQLASFDGPPVPGLGFYTLPPCRLVDTRSSPSQTGGPALAPGTPRSFTVAGLCGIPGDARALAVNVTVTQAHAAGHLTLFPANTAPVPPTSTINYAPGQTRANQAIVPLSPDGTGTLAVQVGSAGIVHLILDVAGYFR